MFANRLRIYTAHIQPSASHPYEEAEFVEEGFNWMGFLFTGLWALYHQLWSKAACIIAFNLLMMQMHHSGSLTYGGMMLINLCVQTYIGWEGNDWIRAKLKKRGMITADIIVGDSLARAELRFFDRYFATKDARAHSA